MLVVEGTSQEIYTKIFEHHNIVHDDGDIELSPCCCQLRFHYLQDIKHARKRYIAANRKLKFTNIRLRARYPRHPNTIIHPADECRDHLQIMVRFLTSQKHQSAKHWFNLSQAYGFFFCMEMTAEAWHNNVARYKRFDFQVPTTLNFR